jgi:hypothetical protein
MPSLEIDLELHRLIELVRQSFSESQRDIIKRVLRSATPSTDGYIQQEKITYRAENGGAWHGDGYSLPDGTKCRMRYNGIQYDCKIENGQWNSGGVVYKSPSQAASALGVTKKGKRTQLDGFKYWEVKIPGSESWVWLRDLRPKVEIDLTELIKGL